MKSDKEEIIMITESVWQSLGRNISSLCSILIIIGIGVVLHSNAMQWFGFWIAMITIFAKAWNKTKGYKKSPQEAADYLFKKFNVKA